MLLITSISDILKRGCRTISVLEDRKYIGNDGRIQCVLSINCESPVGHNRCIDDKDIRTVNQVMLQNVHIDVTYDDITNQRLILNKEQSLALLSHVTSVVDPNINLNYRNQLSLSDECMFDIWIDYLAFKDNPEATNAANRTSTYADKVEAAISRMKLGKYTYKYPNIPYTSIRHLCDIKAKILVRMNPNRGIDSIVFSIVSINIKRTIREYMYTSIYMMFKLPIMHYIYGNN